MRTLIIGFDAFDPKKFEDLSNQGLLPNLTAFMSSGGYSRFSVANPPQSEVSWTSIATGANPGVHGIFDFVHRLPNSYSVYASLLPTEKTLVGTQFIPPSRAETIFSKVAKDGFPATSLWWPATFPARLESPVRTIPGLGTPDILGRLGVGSLLSTDLFIEADRYKSKVVNLTGKSSDRYTGWLDGPSSKKKDREQIVRLELSLAKVDDSTARLALGDQRIDLIKGKWSPIVELQFKMGTFFSVHAITRFILTQLEPEVCLYALPLQIHPLHSVWRYGTPPGFLKDIWRNCGPYLTLGWPQDTTALEEGWIDDDQFLTLCMSIEHEREKVLMHILAGFEEGLLAIVFDTLDRVQHMFWRQRQDVITDWYQRLDGLLGRVLNSLSLEKLKNTRIVIVSDHGFTNFDHKIHLNQWLIDLDYLTPLDPAGQKNLSNVDWSKTRVFAIGLNSLCFNVMGREPSGNLPPDSIDQFTREIRERLSSWRSPEGSPIIKNVYTRDEIFSGPASQFAPDLIVGYNPGFRASSPTGLGEWAQDSIEPNQDHWRADHCIDPQMVPGVIFCSDGLRNFQHPSYQDFPAIAIGKQLDHSSYNPPPPDLQLEDDEIIAERLKGLGYL